MPWGSDPPAHLREIEGAAELETDAPFFRSQSRIAFFLWVEEDLGPIMISGAIPFMKSVSVTVRTVSTLAERRARGEGVAARTWKLVELSAPAHFLHQRRELRLKMGNELLGVAIAE